MFEIGFRVEWARAGANRAKSELRKKGEGRGEGEGSFQAGTHPPQPIPVSNLAAESRFLLNRRSRNRKPSMYIYKLGRFAQGALLASRTWVARGQVGF